MLFFQSKQKKYILKKFSRFSPTVATKHVFTLFSVKKIYLNIFMYFQNRKRYWDFDNQLKVTKIDISRTHVSIFPIHHTTVTYRQEC